MVNIVPILWKAVMLIEPISFDKTEIVALIGICLFAQIYSFRS